jgi:hypothetical protein
VFTPAARRGCRRGDERAAPADRVRVEPRVPSLADSKLSKRPVAHLRRMLIPWVSSTRCLRNGRRFDRSVRNSGSARNRYAGGCARPSGMSTPAENLTDPPGEKSDRSARGRASGRRHLLTGTPATAGRRALGVLAGVRGLPEFGVLGSLTAYRVHPAFSASHSASMSADVRLTSRGG